MTLQTILSVAGLAVTTVYGGVQTYLAVEARSETVEVTRTLANAADASVKAVQGECE